MKDIVDKRFACSDEKKAKLRLARLETVARRANQVVKVYELKIVEKRLNNKQREELKMLFVEGKWFYNHVLRMKKNGIKLRDINTTNIKEVIHFDKDKVELHSALSTLNS